MSAARISPAAPTPTTSPTDVSVPSGLPRWRRQAAEQSLRLVVSPVRHLPTGGFVGLCVLLAVAGLVGVLFLTTAMQERASLVQEMTQQHRELAERQQSLTVELAQRQSPQGLAKAARSLGMVPAGAQVFVDLDSGEIVDPSATLSGPATTP